MTCGERRGCRGGGHIIYKRIRRTRGGCGGAREEEGVEESVCVRLCQRGGVRSVRRGTDIKKVYERKGTRGTVIEEGYHCTIR